MALLNSCCCCCGLRRGSIFCGIFSMVYFFVFSWMSGPMVIYETMVRMDDDLYTRMTLMSEGMDKNDTATTEEIDEQSTILQLFDLSPPPTLSYQYQHPIIYVLSVVDFVAEVLGFFCSIVLLIGLRKDRRGLLIPWLILAPFHAIVDTFMVVFIILGQIEEKSDEDPYDVTMNHVPLLLLDVALNTFTIYMILCIISQYQEYQDLESLGARSYNDLRENGPRVVVVNHDGSRGSARTSNGNGNRAQISNNRSNQKSDIWLEDLMLDKLDGSHRKGKRSLKNKAAVNTANKVNEIQNRNGSGDKKEKGTVTVRFDTSTDGGGSISEGLLKPYSNNSRSSPSGRSTYSSLGFEESTAETVADF